jgi:hypothetical protein
MGVSGLDDDKLSLLAKWAAGLRTDSRPEVVAAGRAIEMLIDEVERLNVLIWEGRLSSPNPESESEPGSGRGHGEAPAEPEVLAPLRTSLRKRIRGALQPNS